MSNESFDEGDKALATAKAERTATINSAIESHVGKEGLAQLESHIEVIGDKFKEYVAVQKDKEAAEHAVDTFRNLVNNLFARLTSANKRSPELVGEALTLSNAALQPEVGMIKPVYAGGVSPEELTNALKILSNRYPSEFRKAAEEK